MSMFSSASPSSTRWRMTSGEPAPSWTELACTVPSCVSMGICRSFLWTAEALPERLRDEGSVRLFPILSRSEVDYKGYLELRHPAHQAGQFGPDAVELALGNLEHQLVVHLH